MIFDINGNSVSKYNWFEDLIVYRYQRDEDTGIFYTTMLLPQKNAYDQKQYPFVYYPNYPNARTESPMELNARKNFLAVFSGGRFDTDGIPFGTVIQNGEDRTVKANDRSYDRVLTINNAGALGYAEQSTPASTLINNGIVSAFTGFIPLIIDFKNSDTVDNTIIVEETHTEIAQRIAICQYDNGDYMVICAEARGYRSASGNTQETLSFREFQQLCKKQGVKFAFSFDGGGSSAMIFGHQNLNPLYDTPNGRKLPVFIVFNGSTEFPG